MKFRDHPALNTWQRIEALAAAMVEHVSTQRGMAQGEIGTLERVWIDELLDTCVFLHMRDDVFRYIGALCLDDRSSAIMIYSFLKSVVGRPITEIGDLDLSHLL